jgi:hypothetical protein
MFNIVCSLAMILARTRVQQKLGHEIIYSLIIMTQPSNAAKKSKFLAVRQLVLL